MGEKGFAGRLRLCDRLPDRTYLVQNKLRDFGVFFFFAAAVVWLSLF